jgi:hypothetical protein
MGAETRFAGLELLSGRTAMVHITMQALGALGDDALVFDWHRIAICCACAGEVSLRRAPRARIESAAVYRRLDASAPVYAHRLAYPHLAGRDVTVDSRRTFGMRRFTSDLPADFGLRASLGRLPPQERIQ